MAPSPSLINVLKQAFTIGKVFCVSFRFQLTKENGKRTTRTQENHCRTPADEITSLDSLEADRLHESGEPLSHRTSLA